MVMDFASIWVILKLTVRRPEKPEKPERVLTNNLDRKAREPSKTVITLIGTALRASGGFSEHVFISAQNHCGLELPEDDQFSDIRILRIHFLAHSDIRMYSNVDDSRIFGL